MISENISLKHLNTFGIDVRASRYVEIRSVTDLSALAENAAFSLPKLILGGGSNILFTKDFEGIVIHNRMEGISPEREDSDSYYVKAGAGTIWHDLVLYCIERNYQGIENLSLIPGTVGAAPIQNIGAYGVELKEVFDSLEAYHLTTGEMHSYSAADCVFGYRDSVFKKEKKGQYCIVSVTLRLRKNPAFNIRYGAIREILEKENVTELSVKAISDAVIRIRKSKLPDPVAIGNAGSFFKNPEIAEEKYNVLVKEFSDMPGYVQKNHTVKVPAGWLIEQCGWKGKRIGNTGAHKDQALVLVNYGNATGNEIYELAMKIQKSVQDKFDILIIPEVNIM